MNICLIPARGGSKKNKNKNIKIFFNKPFLSFAIKTAIKSKIFSKVYVSTDSIMIANIAKKNGAKIPFIRPKKIASDKSKDLEVINHFLNHAKRKKIKIDTLCYLYPVTPLMSSKTLKRCYKILKNKNIPKVMTIGKFSHPIQRALIKKNNGEVSFFSKKYSSSRSQDLKDYYHDAGQCYWFNIKKFNLKKITKNLKTIGLELKQNEFKDVDTKDDLEMLKILYKFNKR